MFTATCLQHPCPARGLTCGGAAVLGVLGEGNSPLDAIPLHLLDGLLRQGMHVPEADVVLVRRCQPDHRERNCRKR